MGHPVVHGKKVDQLHDVVWRVSTDCGSIHDLVICYQDLGLLHGSSHTRSRKFSDLLSSFVICRY